MLLTDDYLIRIDTTKFYPPFLERLRMLEVKLKGLGEIYIITSGFRDPSEQARIYAIGRTTGTPGHYVTKAPPYHSPHEFGIGADWCLDDPSNHGKPGLKPNYDDKNYKILGLNAIMVGLESGLYWNSDFKDPPHVQLDIKSKGITWAKLRDLYQKRGVLKDVWDYLDTMGPW